MGNICSTSQKNCKDAESEMSEGGDNGSESDHKSLTPDKDKDKHPHHDTGNTLIPNKTESMDNEKNEANQRSTCDENEGNKKTNVCSKANVTPNSAQIIDRDKKIVLYIIMGNKNEYKKHLQLINKLIPNFLTRCKVKGFELTTSFTHHEILSKQKRNHSSEVHDSIESTSQLFAAHDEMANCLGEIERHQNSYIIPILFFGSSLEKPLIPIKIAVADFTFVLSIAAKEQSDLLQKFYKIDNQTQPTWYSFISNSTLNKEETEQILLTLITLLPINLKNTYLPTAAEQFITSALLSSKELAKRCIWIQSEYKAAKTTDDGSVLETEMASRVTSIHSQLKDEISVKNMLPSVSSVEEDEELYELLRDILKANIDSVMHEHFGKYHHSRNTLGMCKQTVAEIAAAKRHSVSIGTNCTNCYDTEGVLRYIRSDSLHPLAVFAKSEEGKSVFATQIAFNMEKWIENSHLILRYSQLTVLSSEITSLLASIADEISIIVSESPSHSQHGISHYKRTIEELLEKTTLNFVVIIDSIDKVVGVKNFEWLPKISKPNLKIILTITNNEEISGHWASKDLTQRGVPKENLLPLIRNSKHPLDTTNGPELKPFEGKLMKRLSSLGVNVASNDSYKMIEDLLQKLESEMDVKILEILLVILAISSYGIYETDCINIFEEQAKVEKTCSLTIWSKFCWLLGPMLIHADRIKIVDMSFQKAILKRYAKNVIEIQKVTKRYYENQADSFSESGSNLKSWNAEKYLYIPLHDLSLYLECGKTNMEVEYFAKAYFTDLSWILNKITSTGCYEYLNEIVIAEEKLKTKSIESLQHMTLLKEFLKQHMARLNYDGSQLYTLLKVFLKISTETDASLKDNDIIKNWTSTIDQLKITHLECLNNDNQENVSETTDTYNEVVILKEPGHYVAAISTDCDEICVWDVPNCKKIRVVKSVPQPSLLCSIRNFEVAVLCKREIKVIDLQEGKHKSTLKGVMNQKMPYFGLHDDDHLVCLSRNRMYVNLMNLKTGDCVTSFKAGEDRFLNSLIVSGNGRILVCGDESQKPFCLLVWHLSQRRLLYDLRIPHHDLFTALSAITYEGLYVSVVAKEIREPGPNFIVVYDLQSGTLFQKLKPACNTVAIAISQANGCVIAGLENAEIMIWDLVTGNCRHTLIGHNAPVTLMKLDPLGSCLLSGDKEGRDLSLRLWELSTGKSLAVYTQPHKISSCEILDNGVFTILAMEKSPGITILQLNNYEKTKLQSEKYVNDNSDCKIYTLNED